VPELCAIHPFSASLWRQAVALPCIMYRLNGLLIADQIRASVAAEMRLGRAVLPPIPTDDENDKEVWPPLNFGWTLADVVNNTSSARANAAQQSGNKNNSACATVKKNGDGNEEDAEGGDDECDGVGGKDVVVIVFFKICFLKPSAFVFNTKDLWFKAKKPKV
jgi:endoribonuclease Dicer